MKKFSLSAFFLGVLSFVSHSAFAHSLPVDHGTININDKVAYLVLSLPVTVLQNVDDNNDGTLSHEEITTHTDAIRAQIKSGFSFSDSNADNHETKPLQVISLTPMVTQNSDAHSHDPLTEAQLNLIQATHLNVLAVVRFETTVKSLFVNAPLFAQANDDYQFSLYAKRVQKTESNHKKNTNIPQTSKRQLVRLDTQNTTATYHF